MAGTCLFVLEEHAAMEGNRNVMVKAYDTDVVVVTISAMHHLQKIGMQKMWVPLARKLI